MPIQKCKTGWNLENVIENVKAIMVSRYKKSKKRK